MPIEFWNFHYMFLVIWLTICKHILQNILIYRGAVYHQDHKVIFIVQQKFFFYTLWWNVFIIWLTICKHVLQNIFIYKGAVYHQDQKIIFTRQQKFFFFFLHHGKIFLSCWSWNQSYFVDSEVHKTRRGQINALLFYFQETFNGFLR